MIDLHDESSVLFRLQEYFITLISQDKTINEPGQIIRN